jgi:hypothetical protein
MSKKKEDEKLNDCYQELFKTVVDMQARYKSNLTEEGFRAMVEVIASSSDTIEPFDAPTIN